MDQEPQSGDKILNDGVLLDFLNTVGAMATYAFHELRSRGMKEKALEIDVIRLELGSFRDRYYRTDIDYQSAVKNVRAWQEKILKIGQETGLNL